MSQPGEAISSTYNSGPAKVNSSSSPLPLLITPSHLPSLPQSMPSALPRQRRRRSKSGNRTKTGCYTCRIRRKKCDENLNDGGECEACVRLHLECLGFGARRPEWLRDTRNVGEMRERIKQFLSSQGMVRGGPGSSSRSPEQDLPTLNLSESEYTSPESPATPIMLLPEEVDPATSAVAVSLAPYQHAIELYPGSGQTLFSHSNLASATMFGDELSTFYPDLLTLPYF